MRPSLLAAGLALAAMAGGPALAQFPAPPAATPGASTPGTVPGAGRPALDPFTARPGVTNPDVPLYDPVTGLPTAARRAARGRGATGLEAPGASVFADPMAPAAPGQAPRAGYPGAPPPVDPFSATPGVQQMRTGTYDPYALPRPGAAPAAPAPTSPPAYGSYVPGGAGPAGNYGISLPQYDPYAGKPDDKYSYGRR